MLRTYFIMALLLSVLTGTMFFGIVNAKPSVPEFTLRLVAHPYDVPTTYELDQSTGANITYPGYHVENKSIEITIINQHISPSLYPIKDIFYNIRYKNHFEDNWTEASSYTHLPSENPNNLFVGNLTHQSDAEYTTIKISLQGFLVGGEIDFQVQAMEWYLESLYIDGRYQMCWTSYETSDWSNTQTVAIKETQTPTPSPIITTPTPNQEYQQSEQVEIIASAAIVLVVIIAGLGLLLYLIQRK